MPTPAKTPKLKPFITADAALVMFAQNLEEIRRWYRDCRSPGQEVGFVTMNELVLANVSTALSLALQGKRWERPGNSPA